MVSNQILDIWEDAIIIVCNRLHIAMTTIRDVAKKAGVSVATVSRVMNNEKYVNDELREHVLHIVSELNYRPDGVARGLRTKSTHIISLVIPDICNPYFPEVSRGIQSVADERGYIVVLCNTGQNIQREKDFYEILSRQKVEGIIINPSGSTNRELNLLQQIDIPIVLISSQTNLTNFDMVMVDNELGAETAVEHLIHLGHRRIGLVGGSHSVSSGKQRYYGFLHGMQKNGVPVIDELITEGSFDHEGGYECMNKLLALPQKPTAVFATNDMMAIGAMSAIFEAGFKVPEDISIIGFDDISFSKMTYPKLTTVSQPKFQTGEVAAKLLFERIEKNNKIEPRRVVLQHDLIIRETTQAK